MDGEGSLRIIYSKGANVWVAEPPVGVHNTLL